MAAMAAMAGYGALTTLWVDQEELVRDIGIDDVRAALLTRQEAVMEALVE